MKFISMILILLLAVIVTMAETADRCFEKMPVGCFVTQSDIIPKAQADASLRYVF